MNTRFLPERLEEQSLPWPRERMLVSRRLEEEQEVSLGYVVFTGVGSWICESGVQGRGQLEV